MKQFMQKAIEIAQQSGEDVPVGAVVVKNDEIISFAHNEKELKNDVTAHAEIQAIRAASEKLGSWRLSGCDMYVTLEPCPMCAWAIMQSRIDNLYFGSYDNLYGAFSVLTDFKAFLNSKLELKGGIMEEECDSFLRDYFEKIRKK